MVQPDRTAPNHPDLRDRLYELLEHNHLPHSVKLRFVNLIVSIVVIDVVAMVLSSVPELDARFGGLFTLVEAGSLIVFSTGIRRAALEYRRAFAARYRGAQARIEYALKQPRRHRSPGIPAGVAGASSPATAAMVPVGMLPFLKLVRYSSALRSLLAALHAERRALFGCLVILTGAVLLFASLLPAIEHTVQPDKFGTIPQAMWWAIVTLGTVGYGDVVPVTPLGKAVAGFAIVGGFMMIALPVAIIATAFADEVRRRDFVVTWGMLARVPLFSHLRAGEISDIMRLLQAGTR